jgi:hypothetical protein
MVFSTQLCELLPLLACLWLALPQSPLPCVNKNNILYYTRIQCVGGGGGYGVIGGDGASDR